jgi:hypothetical protein
MAPVSMISLALTLFLSPCPYSGNAAGDDIGVAVVSLDAARRELARRAADTGRRRSCARLSASTGDEARQSILSFCVGIRVVLVVRTT